MTRRLCAWGLLGALLTLPLFGCSLGTWLGGQTVAAGGGGTAPGVDAGGGDATAAPAVREQSAFLLETGLGRRENGFVRIPAAVTNYSAHWADVTIAVALYDAAGRPLANRNPIAENERMTSQYAIPPGGTLYYSYLRDETRLDGVYARHALSLASAHVAPAAGRLTAELTDRRPNRPAFAGDATLIVRGRVVAQADCLAPQVFVAGYAGGQLVDVVEELVYSQPERTVGEDLTALRADEAGYFAARLTAGGIDTVKVVGGCRPAVAQAGSAGREAAWPAAR
jgi:hypothetical protein